MGHIHNIVVPMDGSPASIAGLSQAVTLAEDLGAAITVLHVDAPDHFQVGSTTAAAKGPRDQAERAMEAAIAAAKGKLGERLDRRAESGEPIRRILETATEAHADLIVLGTHGRVGRLHSLVGSVTEGVVRSAPCPVLTVRHPDGEEESFGERVHGRDAIADQARSSR
jgi:nucleotide-binding universal stress UspA family protein